MAQNQRELWQMACTFQTKHNVWLQFRKSCMGLDVCWCVQSGEKKGFRQNPIISDFPGGGSMCVVFSRTSAISLDHKALWCPKAVPCKSQEEGGFFVHPACHRNQLFLPYLYTTVIFILVYLLSKWKLDLLLDITQSNFLNFSRQTFCLSWYLNILASVLGYKHFSTVFITSVLLLPQE